MKAKTVFVNGTFDVLHRGHVEMLVFARTLGDHLVVAIDSDERVRQLKGLTRPINNQEDRKFLLENLKPVSTVLIFSTDQELSNLVESFDVMVKGSDYRNKPIIGKCKKIIYYDRTHHSSTKTIQNFVDRRLLY